MTEKLTPPEERIIDAIVKYTRKTRDTTLSVTGWGGPRPGAGRPTTGRKKQNFYITDEENEKLRKYLEELRASQ
jgi:hypothetical protein